MAPNEALENAIKEQAKGLGGPADTPPADTPPADTPPADTPPADTPPADTPPADTPPADTPPADTPPADTPPADTPPADTPPADTPQADGILELNPPADTPPADTPPADTPPADTPPAASPSFKEMTGGRFESIEQMNAHIAGLEEKQPFAPAEGLYKELDTYLKKGGNLPDFMRTQLANYDEMSDTDVLVSKMLLDNPSMKREDVEFLINNKYGIDEDNMEESQIRMRKIELSQEGGKARAELKDLQQKTAIPENNQQAEAERARLAEVQKRYTDTVDAHMQSLDHLQFDAGDIKLKYNLNQDQKTALQKQLNNLDGFFAPYFKEDGKIDVASLAEDIFWRDNKKQILSLMVSNASNQAIDDTLKKLKNPSATPQGGGAPKPAGKKSASEQIFNHMNGVTG